MAFKIVAENNKNDANLLHVAQLVQWGIVLSADESYIFLDKRDV